MIDSVSRVSEFELKRERILELMDKQNWDWVSISSISGFSWATGGGRSYINTFDIKGVASLLYSRDRTILLTSNVEMPRLKDEEVDGLPLEFAVLPWHEAYFEPDGGISGITKGTVAADISIPGTIDGNQELMKLRLDLLEVEQERLADLCRETSESIQKVAREFQPLQTEFDVASAMAEELNGKAILSPVLLVASDERLFRHRHPLPTSKEIERYAMLVASTTRYGLYCSVTRLVHFGALPVELAEKSEVCANVDASYLSATVPGSRLQDVLAVGKKAYSDWGYPDEWKLHHQGGLAGYASREIFAGSPEDWKINAGQCFAWNPSIAGVKSEDTILTKESEPEVLTVSTEWPMIDTHLEVKRPGILVR